MLTEDLHRHGTLPGDHIGIVIGVDIDVALLFHQLQRIGQRLGEGITVQHHLAAAGAYALHLQLRRGAWHDDGGLDTQLLGRQRNALGVIARRCRDHATRQFLGRQLRQLVVGAANLEGEHRLQILALEQNLVADSLGKLAGGLQRGFDGDVVDAGSEDLLDVMFEHSGCLGRHCEGTRSLPPARPRRPPAIHHGFGMTRPAAGRGL